MSDANVLIVGLQEADISFELVPGSAARPCAECRQPTFFTPATVKTGERLGGHFICTRCAGTTPVACSGSIQPSQWQEVLDYAEREYLKAKKKADG